MIRESSQIQFDFTNLDYDDDKITKILKNKTSENANYWDFKGVNTKTLTHGYHGYPAMMIPQLVDTFLDALEETSNIKNVFDPFMGSGTTIVSGVSRGLESYGNDINPLARMISKVKSTVIEPGYLGRFLQSWLSELREAFLLYYETDYEVPGRPDFKNIDFWFKDSIIDKLQIIKNHITSINSTDKDIRDFILVAFSHTVRYVSNTRNSEFKLYRMKEEDLKKWNPDVLSVFEAKLEENFKGNNELYKENPSAKGKVFKCNTMNLSLVPDHSFDALITSPPYGDSKTTVAYGQFSRLSLQWLDLNDVDEQNIVKLDSKMLGGINYKKNEEVPELGSPTLKEVYSKLFKLDDKRAKEVYKFYEDIDKTLSEISRVMKKNSYQFWVVGNRRVKKQLIPTHQIIIELFLKYNIELVTMFNRNIPNKTMPKLNSPSNKKGELVETMNGEIIMVFRKKN